MVYSTLEVLLVDEFAPGTSILLSGPPLTRKHGRLVRLLGGDDEDGGGETARVHVQGGQVESAGAIGVFVVDSPTARELDMLSQLVDGVVEIRETETETGCELRLRGLGGRGAG
jgi:hypothetical protein